MKKKLRVLLAVPVLFLVAVVVIAGFNLRGSTSSESLSDTTSGASSSSEAKQPPGEPGSAKARDIAGSDSGAVGTQTVATEPMTRAVISTGQVTIHPTSIDRARSEVMRLVSSWNGTVAEEQTSSDQRGRILDSTITLRVPSAKFSESMDALAGLGKVEQRSRKSEDVTTQVIDNDARVSAAERSIRQIENLLGRAQKLGDIISIENDLARRQADLDSLKSQQAYLADQTALSTINVYLSRAGHLRSEDTQARGFLAGLDGGWTALKGATVILLTVLGAVLPFALVLTILGVPLWLVVRRRLSAAQLNAGSAPAQSA
jgi:hypothetical protein